MKGIVETNMRKLPTKDKQNNYVNLESPRTPTAPPLSQEQKWFGDIYFEGGSPSAPRLSQELEELFNDKKEQSRENNNSYIDKTESYKEVVKRRMELTDTAETTTVDSHLNQSNDDHDKKNNNDNDNEDDDEDGFVRVIKRKHRRNIVGSKKTTNSALLRSSARKADIYVGNCDTDICEKALNDYIVDELMIKPINCIQLKTRNNNYNSFKVTLLLADRVKLLSPNVWPEGIICRKYYNSKYKDGS